MSRVVDTYVRGGVLTDVPRGGNLVGNEGNDAPIVRDGSTEWRNARVPRGWYECRETDEWEIVPPGSTTIPQWVKVELERLAELGSVVVP